MVWHDDDDHNYDDNSYYYNYHNDESVLIVPAGNSKTVNLNSSTATVYVKTYKSKADGDDFYEIETTPVNFSAKDTLFLGHNSNIFSFFNNIDGLYNQN